MSSESAAAAGGRFWQRATVWASAPNAAHEDPGLVRLAGVALPAAIWLIGVLSPRMGGLNRNHLGIFTVLLIALAAVDLLAPGARAPAWRRLTCIGAEFALSFAIVRAYGPTARPSLIYLLPASRSVLLFGERWGLALSLSAWLAYALNIVIGIWPNRVGTELRMYLPNLLAPYTIAVVLSLAMLRQLADRRRVQALYDQLSAAHEELQALHARDREAAVTQERNRLAREIHDTLAHYLTVINVQLEAAEKLGGEQTARAVQQVQRARRLAVECLQEVRRSVAALRAASLEDLALPGALSRLADEFSDGTGLRVDLALDAGLDGVLPPEVALALYRSAQEGLTNVQRHAHATQATLTVGRCNGEFNLCLTDNGVGAEQAEPDYTGGFGLLGLRERIALLGGRLEFGPGESGGSTLAVMVPAAPRTALEDAAGDTHAQTRRGDSEPARRH